MASEQAHKNISKQYGRFFTYIHLLLTEAEDLSINEHVPIPMRKKMLKYIKDFDWIRRDMKTANYNLASDKALDQYFASERIPSLGEYMQIGIECANLDELVEELKQLPIKEDVNG